MSYLLLPLPMCIPIEAFTTGSRIDPYFDAEVTRVLEHPIPIGPVIDDCSWLKLINRCPQVSDKTPPLVCVLDQSTTAYRYDAVTRQPL